MQLSIKIFILLFAIVLYSGLSSAPENTETVAYAIQAERSNEADYIAKIKNVRQTKNALPSDAALHHAIAGYLKLKSHNLLIKSEILTIIDFSLPSTQKRMWIFDMNSGKALIHTYVAHGRNSGTNYAKNFSNLSRSHQSSIGLYLTADTYFGRHGLSLYLDGMEYGLNDQARNRYIVLHGADYVSEAFIAAHGRLGRSHGCPAVSRELNEIVIRKIKEQSCLFIYHPSYKANAERILLANHLAD
jgi:hypothetical protein